MIPCDQENTYHVPQTILDTPQVSIVVCTRCKTEKCFIKGKNERLDHQTYLAFHARNFLQPGHPHYEREFGKPKSLKYNEDKMKESVRYNEQIEEETAAQNYRSDLL